MKKLLFFSALLFSNTLWAWGGRGHHLICEAAVFLVQDQTLRDFLKNRPQMMGHLCNIPDIYWKSLGGEISKLGNPTHFIDVEITGLSISELPTDLKEIIQRYEGQKNHDKENSVIHSIPTELGTLWWRADQFHKRAIDLGIAWQAASPPQNSKEEQQESLPYNQALYQFIVNLGLMGHFVGDASQPFHSTNDYDGYGTGHGGIHAYYEDSGVSVQDADLLSRVLSTAKGFQQKAKSKDPNIQKQVAFLTAPTTVNKMKALTILSNGEIKSVLKVDPVLKKSDLKKEKGMEIKTPAERKPIASVKDKFGKLIVPELARSAALLAALWDEAYEKIGKPKITAYKSYQYPITPEFVPPDYYEIKTEKK